VRADPDREWRSDLPAAQASVERRPHQVTDDELAALDDLGRGGTWEVFGRRLKVTNLDKELFPATDDGAAMTKRDLLRYTAQVAPTVVPYLSGRALNMHRYPDGAGRKGFWHKERPEHAPDWVDGWDNPDADAGETQTYVVANEPATLVWAANFGALEWHAWTSRTDHPDRPTYALIDIDPGERTGWEDVLVLARLHRTAFEHMGVTARAKVTGRRGIQVWVPIRPGPSFDETRAWVETLSRTVGKAVPELVSWKWQKSDRKGLARLDYTQNAVNKTLVAPYSPRASAGAPVSTPIEWDELDDPDLRPDRWSMHTVVQRLNERGDLFRPVLDSPQRLPRLA
jgi:bifunctional non-homologous end joining protein LigD